MAQPTKINFKIYQGSTFQEVLRWESATKVYVPITNITKTAPMVVTADSHGVTPGWRVKITGSTGMKEVNSDEYKIATSVTANTVTFNAVNALGYSTYLGGGVLEYNQPVDLAGTTARMQIRERIDSDQVIHEMATENGGIVVDNTTKTIVLGIDAVTTAGFNFNTAVYSLELVNGVTVTPFSNGTITLVREVTR